MQQSESQTPALGGGNNLAADPDFGKAFMALCHEAGLATAIGIDTAIVQKTGISLWEQFFMTELREIPGMAELVKQRYMLRRTYSIEELRRLAPGTLGRVYADHMIDNQLNPDYFPPFTPDDDGSYVKLRIIYTHDIWHVVAGYKADHLGEAGLQGFYHGQGPFTVMTFLLTATMMQFATREPAKLKLGWEAVNVGWQRGRSATSLWPVRWEEMWERPLDEIRKELNVTPL